MRQNLEALLPGQVTDHTLVSKYVGNVDSVLIYNRFLILTWGISIKESCIFCVSHSYGYKEYYTNNQSATIVSIHLASDKSCLANTSFHLTKIIMRIVTLHAQHELHITTLNVYSYSLNVQQHPAPTNA